MSSISKDAFPELVCPVDLLPLAVPSEGLIRCTAGHVYAERLGIPRLLASEKNYADAFGEQWKKFRTTQLDSYSKTSISRNRLKRCLGEELWRTARTGGEDRSSRNRVWCRQVHGGTTWVARCFGHVN